MNTDMRIVWYIAGSRIPAFSCKAFARLASAMVLFYKLPSQWPRLIPLDVTCTIDALTQYIKSEHRIDSPFKLRVYVGGKARYLRPGQRLEVVAAMGAEVVSIHYRDPPSQKSKRRKEHKQRDGTGDSLSFPGVQAVDRQQRRQQRHDDGVAEAKRRRLEARNVRTKELAIAGPITAPYDEEENAEATFDEEAEVDAFFEEDEEEAKEEADEASFDEDAEEEAEAEAEQDANQERTLGMFQIPLCGICLRACGMATGEKLACDPQSLGDVSV